MGSNGNANAFKKIVIMYVCYRQCIDFTLNIQKRENESDYIVSESVLEVA